MSYWKIIKQTKITQLTRRTTLFVIRLNSESVHNKLRSDTKTKLMMLICSEFETKSEEGCNKVVWYAVS